MLERIWTLRKTYVLCSILTLTTQKLSQRRDESCPENLFLKLKIDIKVCVNGIISVVALLLFKNKRFRLDEMIDWNASISPYFLEFWNQSNYFLIHFNFSLMNALALIPTTDTIIPYRRKWNGAILISFQGFLVLLYSNLSQIWLFHARI